MRLARVSGEVHSRSKMEVPMEGEGGDGASGRHTQDKKSSPREATDLR